MKTLKTLSLWSFCSMALISTMIAQPTAPPCPTYEEYMQDVQAKTILQEENIAVVKDLYTALEHGNLLQIHKQLATDIEWNGTNAFPCTSFDPHIGSDVVLATVFNRFGEGWYQWKLLDLHFSESAAGVIKVEGSYQAEHLHDPTSQTPFVHLIKVQAGKIVSFQNYENQARMAVLSNK